jgi:hypothetical protein
MAKTVEQYLEEAINKGGIASETTAKDILSALQGKPGSAQDKLQKSFLELDKSTQGEKKKRFDFNKFLERAGTGFQFASGGMEGLTAGLRTGAANLTGFNQVLVNTIASLTAIVGQNVMAFRDLATIGANATTNVNELRRIAGLAGIDMNRLVGALVLANTSLTALAGDSAKGATKFNQIIGSLTNSEFAEQVTGLGFQMEDITEGFSEYVKLQTTLGRAQTMTDMELQTGAQNYLLTLDALTRLTGMQRDQVKDTLQAAADDKRLRLIMNDEIGSAVTRVTALTPELGEALKGMISRGFPRGAEEVGLFAVKGVREAVQALRQGVPGASDMLIRAMATQAQANDGLSKEQKLAQTTLIGVGNGFFDVQAYLQKFGALIDQNTGAIIDQQKAFMDNKSGMKQLDRVSEKFRNSFNSFVKPFTDMTDKLVGFVVPALDFVANIAVKVGEAFNDFYKKFPNATTAITALTTAVLAAGTAFVGYKATKSVGSYLTGGGGAGKQAGGSMLGKLGAGGGGILGGIGAGLKGLAGGLTAFANPAVLIGAGALGLSITAIGAGIAAATWLMGGALGKFGEGLKSIGEVDGSNLLQVAKGTFALSAAMVAMGAGSTFNAIGGVVSKIFGGGSENFAKNLNKTLDELDKNKIDMYANSLENLGNAMTNLRSGMTGTITASSSSTGDKLDRLNNTMEQILLVLGEGNRYSRITSKSTKDTAENFG